MSGGESFCPPRWMAFVPLREPRMTAPDAVVQWYAQNYPDAPPLAISTDTERLAVWVSGESTLAATLVAQTIPWSQLEGPSDAAWYWPEAEAELRQHQAHWILVLADEPGKGVEHAMMLTRLAAAVVATSQSNALGLVWGPARLVHAPEPFVTQAQRLTIDDLPLFLWIDFRVDSVEGTRVRLHTTGLEALGASELETEDFYGEPHELVRYAYNVAHYQLANGKRINSGDTLSVSDERQMTAHRGTSMLGGGREVIRMEFSD